MYSAYKLNKQSDNIQPGHTPFLIWNQTVVPCLVLTVASWPAYLFLRRQAGWSGIPISLRIFHSLLWSTQSKVFSSVQFSHSVMSNSLWPHELQHDRPPCPSPTPGVYPNLCPLSQWCHPTILSSVIPFSWPQSFPASGSFQMSQLFPSVSQSIRVSASTSVLPMNTQDWSPLRWTGWISLQSKDSQESSPAPQFKSISSSVLSFLYDPTLISIHDPWKNHSFDYTDLCRQSGLWFLICCLGLS